MISVGDVSSVMRGKGVEMRRRRRKGLKIKRI